MLLWPALVEILVEFAFISSSDETRDSELLAKEVRTEDSGWLEEMSELEGREELDSEFFDEEGWGEHDEVLASQESSVREEVTFSKELGSTWVWLIFDGDDGRDDDDDELSPT